MTALHLDYGTDVENAIARVASAIDRTPDLAGRYPTRWLAVSLVDDDPGAADLLDGIAGGGAVAAEAASARAELAAIMGPAAATAIAAARYDWINRVVAEVVAQPASGGRSPTDRVDAIVTNRWLGIPIFLGAMWIVFGLTTDVAAVFLDWIDAAVAGPLSHLTASLLDAIGLGDTWVESLLVDGVLAGVGAVVAFIPVLLVLYLALALLEDSGYMARAAFVMDRVMGGIGLPGKSFLPMLVGFGCTVPAIYATRTLERRRDRILTGLLVPFMSCGARLPVYVLISTAFFPRSAGTVVFLMYLLGIVVAVGVGFVLQRTLLRRDGGYPTIMELPPYRVPTLRSLRFQTWGRTRAFLADAGSIILGTSLLVWLLMSIPVTGDGGFASADVEDSAFATTAAAVAPALDPLGFGSWEAAGSLLTGFVAKEVVISTMGQAYGVAQPEEGEQVTPWDAVTELARTFGIAVVDTFKAIPGLVGVDLLGGEEAPPDGGLVTRIQAGFEQSSGGHGALAGVAFMVFVLLYTPCMAAVAAERRELGTRWMWTSIVGQTALAWLGALLVFQVGKVLLP